MRISCIGNLWVLRLYNDMEWNWNVSIYLLAIEIHSDVTPSYVLMWSNRRGLWWICNEFKPLPAYTKNGGKLTVFFWGFFPSFPNESFTGFVLNSAQWWWFLSKYLPNGVSGFIFQCAIQHGILSIGILYWLEGSVWWYCWWVGSASDKGNA